MDPGSSAATPERVPAEGGIVVGWGLGDFFWIYFAGIVASIVGASVGFAISGDTAGHTGAVTTARATLSQFGTWFGGVVFIAQRKGRSVRQDFGLTLQRRDWWAPFAGLGLFFVGSLMIAPLVNLANEKQQVVDDLRKAGGAKLAVFAVVAAIVAPVCEELLFRGLLLRALRRRMSPVMAVIVQALAFALAHPMLSPTLGDLAVVPALFMLGAVSGVVAVRRGDIGASILMHIGFNFVTTVFAL